MLVDLFGAHFQPGIDMSGPQRSGPVAGPIIWELGDMFPLLERKASARHLLTALSCIEDRIAKAEAAPDSAIREGGVAFAGQL